VTAVLRALHLKDLSIGYQSSWSSMHELVGATVQGNFLTSVVELDVTFSDGHGLAPALLLDAIPNIEELTMVRSTAATKQSTILKKP
jgi:hypothetical protein